jgi:hypothetical protein
MLSLRKFPKIFRMKLARRHIIATIPTSPKLLIATHPEIEIPATPTKQTIELIPNRNTFGGVSAFLRALSYSLLGANLSSQREGDIMGCLRSLEILHYEALS